MNNIYHKENSVQDTKIGKHLPLTSIDSFLTFEEMLKDDQEAFTQVIVSKAAYYN